MRAARFKEIEPHFREVWDACRAMLTDDDNNYILHYLEHGEPELAGEILGLGMMTNDKVPVGVRLNMLRLATELNIDQGSGFDAELWRKLRVFASEPTS